LAFRWAAKKMSLSRAIAASSALIERSRPTKSCETMCGNTMMSRSGRSGTVRLLTLGGPLLSISLSNSIVRTSNPHKPGDATLRCATVRASGSQASSASF
jgi:hypothetical protein